MRKVDSTSRIYGSNSQGRVMSNFQGIHAALRLMAAAALSLLVAFSAPAQTVRYIHTDALGSPVLVTDKSRNVVELSEYEPYGSLLNRPVTDGPGYTGHVMDSATSLTYMQQRYYDPQIGRFLSVDPVTVNSNNGINFSRYWYASNNPYTNTDPDGRCDGPSTCAIDNDIAAMNRGEISRSDFMERSEARAAGALMGAVVIAGAVGPQAQYVRNSVVSGSLEVATEAGKQVLIDGKEVGDVSIDKSNVAVAAAVGAFAPGSISTAKTTIKNIRALRALRGQAANTAARAAKLQGRISAHVSSLKTAIGAWLAAKIATKSTQKAANEAEKK
ncbi:RHS repeat-associated core domain-containing protein [Xanthomonas sp. PPL568]|uniref:RHS repeat-associated core domain-containing protein n=1 Tax=Xanthomonas indica TaxID=2912242 RepID=UPI001F56A4EB|nr:RHS repeat-associated core domain-containing protein [Xanthomonas indica]MCI2245838.1 RHS repeat-associated core domain-containing protein [Xanthomonas indica]